MENIRFGVFDIDGTLKTAQEVPLPVIEGFARLWANDVTTTVMTGRGYLRMREILGQAFSRLISPRTPIGLEGGARIINYEGERNEYYFPLASDEIQAALRLCTLGETKFLAYYPEDPTHPRPVLWTPTAALAAGYQKYSYFADIVQEPVVKLEARMIKDRPCMLAIAPQNAQYTQRFVEEGLNATLNVVEINVTPQGVDKASGVRLIADHLDLPLSRTMVAGNGLNDLPMLNIAKLAKRVMVGEALSGMITLPFDQVSNPEGLGYYLQEF